MKWESAAALVAAAFVTAACADSKPAAPPATTAPAAVAPATTAPAATTTGAASEYGVPECDSYMKAWQACVDSKVPAEYRAQYKTAFDASKASYTAAAATPQGKAGLAQMCTQSMAATKQALASYNCTW
jgi:hypothetical protein